uniref:Putative tritil protein n=1 Tax=Rhipicephalus pulchellus TaxID=72859 RepID=L7LTK6_RHIPC
MHQITIALAALCIAVVRGSSTCQDCGTTKCGPNEVPVVGNPRQDLFCRPLYTPPLVFKELRKCVCKPNFVRNSWGECVDRKSCERCKPRMQKDWHTCSSSCPITANKTISLFCRTMCTPGCDCPPGWVLDPRNWKHCVKAIKYPPICPPNSRFKPCVSTCEPVCGLIPPRPCFTHCHRGACVCNKGFAAFVRSGIMICVPQEKCPWYLRRTHVSVLNRTAYAEGASAHGVVNNVGGFVRAPDGVVTPKPSGPVFSGNVTDFIGIDSHGNSGIDLSRTAISTGATSLGSEVGSRGMGAGVTAPSSETRSGAVGSVSGGNTLSTASGRTATVTMTTPGALRPMSSGMITAGVNGASAPPPDSVGMNVMHASLGAAGLHAGVGFVDGAHSSGSRTPGAAVLLAGRGHGGMGRYVENTQPSALAASGGVGTGARGAPTAVYSGRGGIMTGTGGTSARTPFSVDSGGIRADLGSTGTHEGVHTEHGALSSGSSTAGAGGLSAGTVRGSIVGGVGNALSPTSVPSSNNGVSAGNAHMTVSSVSTGFMSGLGETIPHKPLATQSSGVRTGLGSTGTDGGVHTTPGTSIIGPGTSLASSSLLSAAERMRVIRSSLVIPPAPASRTPGSVSAETSTLRAVPGIHGSTGAGPAEASSIGINSGAPSTHLYHMERGAVNIRRNSAGATGFLSSATGLGAIGTTTGTVPTPFTGDRAVGNTNARSVLHDASFRPGIVGAGTGGTSTSPDFSAEHGGARFRVGTAQIPPSTSVGSNMISLGAGSAGTAGSLSLAAPGFSRVGTNTVSALAHSSVRGTAGATEASGGISGVSARPNGINASVSTSGTSEPLSTGRGGVDLGFGATSSPSHGLVRPGTLNIENRQPSFSLGTRGANVMTGAGNDINAAGENSHLSGGFNNVVNRAVVLTTVSGAPVLSGTRQPHGLSGSTGTEEALTSVSRESGGSGIVINSGSESISFGAGNARSSSGIIAGNGVAGGAPMPSEGARSGSIAGAARGNNLVATGVPSSNNLGSHSGIGSSYIGGLGAGGFPARSGATGSRDVGAFGGTDITTNTHSTRGSGVSAFSSSRETRGLTGTDTSTADASRTGPGGAVLPSAATSSVSGIGTYLSGVTTEGDISHARTTGDAQAGGARTNGIVRHGDGTVPTYEVGQYLPNTAGYHGIGYGVNPYLPGYMFHGGKDDANAYLTVKPADTNI